MRTRLILTALLVSACRPPSPAVQRVPLDQGWTLAGVDTFTAGFPAAVPGTVHTDLLANGLIPDPFWRDNEMRLQWVGERDWNYTKTFEAGPEILEREKAALVFHGLDTFAEVILNGELVLEADNMFREWTVDVTRRLLPGENTLEVRFRSPLPIALAAHDALPYTLPAGNDRGDPPTRVFVRKAAYHYGWDWGPRFVTSGIWRPVELVAWTGAHLTDLHLSTDSLDDEMAHLIALVEVEVSTAEAERRAAGGQIPATITLRSPEGAFPEVGYEAILKPGLNEFEVPLGIPRPERWWPAGFGDQRLYTVTAALDAGLRTDTLSTRIGLRTVELVTEADSIGESFFFRVNGVPVFMKGANVIPLDHFSPRVTPEAYRALFRDVVDANMNMLRVWGGGIYEEDIFYDLADEAGVLLWQDFMFANGMYPGDSAFLESVEAEARDQVRRLRGHPSIALWCGNNEMEEGWRRWGWARAYGSPEDSAAVRDAYDAIFHRILPGVVEAEDPARRYWPSSPSLGWGDPESLSRGDSHYWGVWHGQEPFRVLAEKLPRFSSEFGFQAFPPMETVEAFTAPGDRSLFNPVLLVHQKHPIGNELILEYMERDYPVPASFPDFVYVSQLLQARGMRTAFEAHRRARPRTMGSLYWQLNDTWPVVSWSSRDYFGRWKALHFAARDAFEPLLLSPSLRGDTLEVWGVSDRLERVEGVLSLELLDFRGTSLWQAPMETSLPANASRLLWSKSVEELLSGAEPGTVVFSATLLPATESATGGADGPSALLYFQPPKALELEAPVIQVEWEADGDEILLTLQTDVLAKSVYLRVDPESAGEPVASSSREEQIEEEEHPSGNDHPGLPVIFSDNFFDLLPGRPRTVSLDTALPFAEVQRGLRIRTLAEVPREGLPSEIDPVPEPRPDTARVGIGGIGDG
jgi:beta-mannosidase